MSTSRLFSVLVVLTLVVVAILTVRAGIATSEVVWSGTVPPGLHPASPWTRA